MSMLSRLGVVLGWVALVACAKPAFPELYLGPPGTLETHAVITVQAGNVAEPMWRLRSQVQVEDATSVALLPEEPPSQPLAFPTDYAVVARDRTGVLSVLVDALAEDGRVVGRGRGSAELVPNDAVMVQVVLGKACDVDLDCQDGVFCNGEEQCLEGICQPGQAACAPSAVDCVEVVCGELARACQVTARHDRCAPVPDEHGTPRATYCDATLGCLGGLPGAPYLVGDAEVTPAVARRETLVSVAFQVSEPVLHDPVVQLQLGAGQLAPLVVSEEGTDRSALRYLYLYTPSGTELPGRHDIKVDLVDLSANTALGLAAGSVQLDFLAPSLAGVLEAPAPALRAGVAAQMVVVFSEDVAGQPTACMAPTGTPAACAVPWTYVEPVGERGHRFQFQAAGSEAEGSYAVYVSAQDAAGNASGLVAAAATTLDFTPPTLAPDAVRVLPSRASVGRTVLVEVRLPEAVTGEPRLEATGVSPALDFTPGLHTAELLTFLHSVAAGEDAEHPLRLSGLVDAAGNEAAAATVATVVFDGTAPQLVDFTQNKQVLNAQDTLVVSFASSEVLAGPPQVRLGVLPLLRMADEAGKYVYQLAMAGSGLMGEQPITVQVVDLVDNAALVTAGTAVVDAVPPTLVDVTLTPEVAPLGGSVYLVITASEPLAGPPVLVWQGPPAGPGFIFKSASGTTYSYTARITAESAAGVYRLNSLTLVDAAQNVTQVNPEDVTLRVVDLTVDNHPPVISNLAVNHPRFSAQPGYRDMEVSFTLSKDVALASVQVSVGGVLATCQMGTGPRAYLCRHTVASGEREGAVLIQVSATDTAGNVGFDSTAVELDFTPPAVLVGSVALRLVPPPGSPLLVVSAATQGTTTLVSFTVSEPLLEDPLVVGQPAGDARFSLSSRVETAYSYFHVLDAGGPFSYGENLQVVATLVDTVGNHGDVTLDLPPPGWRVDLVAPDAPAVETPGAVLYTRIPWGAERSQGSPAYLLRGNPGAVEPGTLVIAYDRPGTGRSEIGRVQADGDGAFGPLSLLPADRLQVSVSAVDSAGNPSAVVPVRDGAWVATLAGKVPGSDVENPHRWGTRARFPGQRLVPEGAGTGSQEEGAASGVASRDGAGPVATGGESMVRRNSHVQPAAAKYAAMAYDAARGKTVLFGGQTAGNSTLADTWEWDGVQWKQAVPTDPEGDGNPIARFLHGMAYDARRERVVLFGGANSSYNATNETWEWDGASWKKDRTGYTNAERGVVMTYHPGLARTVKFGPNGLLAFDGTDWLPLDGQWGPDGAPVGSIWYSGALVYDPRAGALVFFGGEKNNADLWSWQGTSWKRHPASGVAGVDYPVARYGHVMVYDYLRDCLVLQGGATPDTFVRLADQWEARFDGVEWAWTLVTPGASPDGVPSAREAHAAAWHGATGSVVMSGGTTSSAYGNGETETWSWDGLRWDRRNASNAASTIPSGRVYMGMGYDPERRKVVAYGGGAGNMMSDVKSDLWEYDGDRWALMAPGTPAPEARIFTSLAYEPSLHGMLLFGGQWRSGFYVGYNGDTWLWNGTKWRKLVINDDEADGEPVGRETQTMELDTARNRVVLFGGTDTYSAPDGATWEWVTDSWQKVHPGDPAGITAPIARRYHAMAFDAARNRMVVFGGANLPANSWTYAAPEVWEWDGQTWTNMPVTDPEGDGSPTARAYHRMFFDAGRQQVVMVGGYDGNVVDTGAWAWTGSSWTRLALLDPEADGTSTFPQGLAVAADSTRGVAVFQGGMPVYGSYVDEVWEWQDLSTQRPGQVMSIRVSQARLPAAATLAALTVHGVARGTSTTEEGAATGEVDLVVWSGVRWEPGSSAPGAAGAWVTLDSTATGDAALRQRLVGADQSFHVGFIPAGRNSPRGASLEVDYAEAELQYRLP